MTGMADDLVISVMTEDEVRLAVDWAAREGWNPGLADADAFRSADPDGFLIGRVDGAPVAVISAVCSSSWRWKRSSDHAVPIRHST